MKKVSFISLAVILAMVLSACSVSEATLTNQAAAILRQAAEAMQPAAETAPQVALPAETSAAQATPAPLSGEISSLLAAYQGALEGVYAQVNPSVVNIRVLVPATRGANMLPSLPFEFPGLPFEFPGVPGGEDSPQTPGFGEGLGSGFVWDLQGHIVTNNHVVEGASKIEVTFADGSSATAELVGTDPDTDLAVIKVNVADDQLMPVTLADSRNLKVGQLAIAIGNPFGLEGTMTVGIISALGRTMPANAGISGGPAYSIPDIIQTDAPINPGNSGGVLVNTDGQVVGVTFAIESSTGSNAGIGFVIPSAIVARVVPDLIKNGSYAHPYLGISAVSLTPALAEAMNLDPSQRGALIMEVSTDSPAAKAGLRGSSREAQIDGQTAEVGGDVIIAANGQTIRSMDDLIAYLANNTSVGDALNLTVLRDGKSMQIAVTLQARPSRSGPPQTGSTDTPKGSGKAWLGITASPLTPEIAQAMNLEADQQGVLVGDVQPGGPADQAGLRGSTQTATIEGQQVVVGGDVIIAIEGKRVANMDDLVALLEQYKPGQKITLTVLRDGSQVELAVTLGERPQ